MEVRRSALVAHPAEHLYRLIEAAEDYPKFLPWCAAVTLLHRDEHSVSARIDVAWRGVRFSLATVNEKRYPHWMSLKLHNGPFKRFDGEWRLTPLSDWGCRVEFLLNYEFNASLLGTLAAPVFEHATNTLVDAFVRRADEVPMLPPPPPPGPPPAVVVEPAPAHAAPAGPPAAAAPQDAAAAPEAGPSTEAASPAAPPAEEPAPPPVSSPPLQE